MLLAGDIGGTKTALGVYSLEKGPHTAVAEGEVHSADYPSLESIVKEFLARTGLIVDRACFGVAGPVMAGRAKITNLPWTVDQAAIARELDLKAVHLLNDLEATACAVPVLRSQDVESLSAGERSARILPFYKAAGSISAVSWHGSPGPPCICSSWRSPAFA